MWCFGLLIAAPLSFSGNVVLPDEVYLEVLERVEVPTSSTATLTPALSQLDLDANGRASAW